MRFIWATRGRDWGFRFLSDAGLTDPLREFERVMSRLDSTLRGCADVGDLVAVRFSDPMARADAAGRVIPHEFVVYPPLAAQIRTVEDALSVLWPLVADEYNKLWAQSR